MKFIAKLFKTKQDTTPIDTAYQRGYVMLVR